jgi:cardiolipin synthase A/B
MEAPAGILDRDDALQRQAAAHNPVSDCPLLAGAGVTLLPGGGETLTAVFEAVRTARHQLLMEYYTFEDVHWRGRSLVDLLVEKLGRGVQVAISYDGAGSQDTDDALFDRLRQAGAALLEFRPLNPLRRRFNPLKLNDRDHRKLLVADQRIAFLGGVNMSRVYENPRSAGPAANTKKAFWYDAAVRIEGPPVAEVQKLFFHSWQRQGGDKLPQGNDFPRLPEAGKEIVRTDGSAPRERRQLYFESLKAAVTAARSHILLATGYFVPTHRQWRLLADAAQRGVTVDLLLAGHSDLPSCTHAARALYGRLLKRGVRIHELRDGVLHAKVATIDGVWTAIGSSNLDRRSFVYNNEVDAIVLGRATAGDVEAMLCDWIARAEPITRAGWESRSLHEHAGELLARLWSRYM